MKRSPLPDRTAPPKRKRSKPRRGPLRDEMYKAFVRGFHCAVCIIEAVGRMVLQRDHARFYKPSEAAHAGERGLGQKCSDRETIPPCAAHHRTGPDSHHVLGKKFWAHHGLDKDAIIAELNRLYDQERSK